MSPEPCLIYNDDDTWTLEREFSIASRGYQLVVPGGFRFDLASIPRALWSLEAPFELSIAAPLIHDWGYRHGGVFDCAPRTTFTRADVDAFFLDIMQQRGVSWLRRNVAYRVVRAFGAKAWQAR